MKHGRRKQFISEENTASVYKSSDEKMKINLLAWLKLCAIEIARIVNAMRPIASFLRNPPVSQKAKRNAAGLQTSNTAAQLYPNLCNQATA
jgi:gamma-glutamyl phosphate reductase